MREYEAEDIRNFAIVGHGSSGKTMLAEVMLACSGVISRPGSIENGTTISDYHDDEKERKISIHASLMHTEWNSKKFNIIDTPGYIDFISEGLGALRVGDFALVVVHANSGVEVGTDQVWGYADHYKIPKMVVVNAADKENIDFDQVLEQIRERFGRKVFPLTLPVNPGPEFNRILDVLRSEFITCKGDGSKDIEESSATGEWKERVDKLHAELIEYVAESDDTLLERFFEEGGLSEEEMRSGIHAAIQNESFIPLFVTSCERNVGVTRLMDFIAKYGSSPIDRKTVTALDEQGTETDVSLTGDEPVLYVFKTLNEAHIGELSFFRLYSGTVTPGTELYNTNRKCNERLGHVYMMNGKNREDAKVLHAGDIAAAVKLKDTHTNNTLCSVKHHVTLPEVNYPKPNIHAALKAKVKGEEEKIAIGLSTLREEDPTFLFHEDSELHQTVISGQGELHLKVISDALKKRFKVDIELGKPKIPYRETIQGPGESKYRHKKQSGGAGQFAEVWMRIEPKERGEGVEFTQSLVGQNVDRVFVPSVEKGVNAACVEGILAGYRVVDLKVDFYDGKQHPVDSKDVAFQIAGKHALRQAFLEATPCLLEPILNVEVKVPEECMGDVMGDISSRRGRILGMEADGHFQVVKAEVPQAELHQYSSTLRSMTGGRGLFSEDFSHYEVMPHEMQQKVIEESKEAEAH